MIKLVIFVYHALSCHPSAGEVVCKQNGPFFMKSLGFFYHNCQNANLAICSPVLLCFVLCLLVVLSFVTPNLARIRSHSNSQEDF